MQNKHKKNQISIFLIIAIIVLVLVIFLIFSKYSTKNTNINTGKTQLSDSDKQKLNTIKTNVDYCLDKQLKKGLIITGLRGGLIYDYGEYYFPGTIPANTYNPDFISNLDPNFNNLISKVLVLSHDQIEIPPLTTPQGIYNHSLSQDLKRYITEEFIQCLNFTPAKEIFDINYTDYLGELNSIDYNTNEIQIKSMDANLNDKVQININQMQLNGTITSVNNNIATAKFNDLSKLSFLTDRERRNLKILNLNKSLNLTININEEDVSAKINFPIIITNKDFKTTYEDSNVNLNIRYKILLDLAHELLKYKYVVNKSINYLDKNNVISVLNRSSYFKSTKYKDLELQTLVLKDEQDHKQYVYSLIDHDSKILGNPFVLNFGYENMAPVVHFEELNPNMQINEQTHIISLIAANNHEITYNLRDFTDEFQYYDTHIFRFNEQLYDRADAYFSLNEDGTQLKFFPHEEKIFRYNIHVTDGETSRDHILEFITGLPDNTNNQEAPNCLSFINYADDDNLFPIANSIKSTQNIFAYNASNNIKVYGLSNYADPNLYSGHSPIPIFNNQDEILFSKTCIYNPNMYGITVESDNALSTPTTPDMPENDGYYHIKISRSSLPVKYTINTIDKQTGNTVPGLTSFEITIYPSSCLGPDPKENPMGISCCNFQKVIDAINQTFIDKVDDKLKGLSAPSNQPTMLKIGDEILNKDIYLCYNSQEDSVLGAKTINYETEKLWDVDPYITSLFKSHALIECEGLYPSPVYNIQSIGTGQFGGVLDSVADGYKKVNNMNHISISMSVYRPASECSFCSISNVSFGFLANMTLRNGSKRQLKFEGGLVENNDGSNGQPVANIAPLLGPNNGNYWNPPYEDEDRDFLDSIFVLCGPNAQTTWYGAEDQAGTPYYSKSWTTGISFPYGDANDRHVHEISKGYCWQDDVKCSGREPSPTYQKADDGGTDSCTNKYFQDGPSGPYVAPQFNTGWACTPQYVTGYSCNTCSGTLTASTADRICNSGYCLKPGTQAPTRIGYDSHGIPIYQTYPEVPNPQPPTCTPDPSTCPTSSSSSGGGP